MHKLLIAVSAIFLLHTEVSAQSQNNIPQNAMGTKIFLSQQVAKLIAQKAEEEAIKNKWTVAIAVVDEAGQLIHYTKMDESTNASGDVAIAKAKHAAYYRRDTKFHEDLLTKGNNLVLTLPNAMPLEGGVQLIYRGKTIGAIGVSGASSQDDGKIARVGAYVLESMQKTSEKIQQQKK